jgi:outer membrane protein
MSMESIIRTPGRSPRRAPQPRAIAVAAAGLISLGLSLGPSSAHAQQALSVFLDAADEHALDLREAELSREQARSQIDEARARWLPSFSATAGYTRNEVAVEVEIPTGPSTTRQATISPLDQLDLTLQVNVPVVDVASWLSFASAEAAAEASEHRVRSARVETRLAVATAYYQVVATRALVAAARRSRQAAEANLARAVARRDAQLASELDVARAEAEIARADQQISDAELQVALAERSLAVLTGIAPASSGAQVSLEDDLHEEPPVDGALGALDALPEVRAGDADVHAAGLARDAAWAAFAPVVSAFARERITNAAGFGPNAIWALGVQASFTLDFLRPAQVGTRSRQAELAALRRERAHRTAETRALEAWNRVRSSIGRARAARTQESAARRARDVAVSRLEAQLGTQLDVFVAERDLYAAEASRIQAEADLAVARLVLRARTLGDVLEGGGS